MILDQYGVPFPQKPLVEDWAGRMRAATELVRLYEEVTPPYTNYLATMTKAELVEYAQTKMMELRGVLSAAKRIRKRMARERFAKPVTPAQVALPPPPT
jgi:hypothetical protein